MDEEKTSKTSAYEAVIKAETCLRRCVKILSIDEEAGNSIIKTAKERTKKNLEKIDISLDDIDKLNIIHVAGTKGKGSTCYYCESILRHCGYKTGLLMYEEEMPTNKEMYFLMAMKIFTEEKVDALIVEVGIGGEYDYTNTIRNPIVCGITSIGVDHTEVLGETVQQIAWHKGGIIKAGAIAITCSQNEKVLAVLHLRAIEKGVLLKVAPVLDVFEKYQHPIELGIHGHGSRINAALALQLCNAWMTQMGSKQNGQNFSKKEKDDTTAILEGFPLSDQILSGLRECSTKGVCQTVKTPGVTYYLDNAHTTESIQFCERWFSQSSREECQQIRGKTIKILMFFTVRDPVKLLSILAECYFDVVIFPGYELYPYKEKSAEFNSSPPILKSFANIWRSLSVGEKPIPVNVNNMKPKNKLFSEECQRFLTTNGLLLKENGTTEEAKSQETKHFNGETTNYKVVSSTQTENSKELKDEKKTNSCMKTKETNGLKAAEKLPTIIKEFKDIQTSMMWIKQLFVEQNTDKYKDVEHIQVLVTGGGIVNHVLYLLHQKYC